MLEPIEVITVTVAGFNPRTVAGARLAEMVALTRWRAKDTDVCSPSRPLSAISQMLTKAATQVQAPYVNRKGG